MKCFVHHDQDAVGTCKACQKGLCPACAVDAGHSLTCKGACEQRAALVEKILQRSGAITDAQRKYRYMGAAFVLFMGVAFTGWGLWYDNPLNFSTLLGIGFLAYGLVLLRASIGWAKAAKASGG